MNRTGFVSIGDGAQIAYTWYNPQQGIPLGFCPGLGGTQRGFEEDARYFSSMGKSVFTLDLRGLGKSIPPDEVIQSAFTPERMAQDIAAVLQHCGIEQFDFVGNSLGGVLGLELIKQTPDFVRSLITFGTTYHLNLPRVMATVQTLVLRIIGKKRLPNFIAKKATAHDHARQAIRDQFAIFPFDVAYCMAKNIVKYDYRDVATHCNKPILMIRGSRDKEINNVLKSTLDALENCKYFTLAELTEAGHFTNLDKPMEVRDLIVQFLEKNFPERQE